MLGKTGRRFKTEIGLDNSKIEFDSVLALFHYLCNGDKITEDALGGS